MHSTRSEIVRALESQGMRCRTFVIRHDSPHALADWDWNQRDLLHVPRVHGGFRFIPTVVEEERAIGMYLQQVLGARVPLAVAFSHPEPRRRIYQAALGPVALVIEATLAPLPAGTEVSTTYSLGAAPWLAWLLPLAERFLRANYRRLHDEDEPLRQRRSQLRAWGYRFASDQEGAGYRRSLDLGRRNVIAPKGRPPEEELDLAAIGERAEWWIGRDDLLGLRVVRDGARLRVFARACEHEGASLDGCDARGDALRCPWHGRLVPPLCTFALDAPGERCTPHHRLRLEGRRLHILATDPAPG